MSGSHLRFRFHTQQADLNLWVTNVHLYAYGESGGGQLFLASDTGDSPLLSLENAENKARIVLEGFLNGKT